MPSLPGADGRGQRLRPVDRDLRDVEPRLAACGRCAPTYSTTTDGRGASKPVTVIFARPGLPSAFGCMIGITRPG